MSWSANITVDTAEGDWDQKINELSVPWQSEDEDTRNAQAHQVAWAKETAIDAIDCGVVGKNKKIGVSLNGHANPIHEPAEGWANDMITVSLYQR